MWKTPDLLQAADASSDLHSVVIPVGSVTTTIAANTVGLFTRLAALDIIVIVV